MVTLGCARNEVDSEELAGRLEADGFRLVDDPESADTVLVNTCGFVEAAKKDSVDAILEAADLRDTAGHGGRAQAVVAVGLHGRAVRRRAGRVAAGGRRRARLRRLPRHRGAAAVDRGGGDPPPAHAAGPAPAASDQPAERASAPVAPRARLDRSPTAPLKLANGCDRRCTFCAIPMFRGSFVSRRPSEVLDEARWLAADGVRELFLVSENSTSYGKDLGDLRLLETLLPELAGIDGVERVRVSYLQPAETRPGLIEAIATTPGVTPYFDLSFQHASNAVLRRMRRFGDPESFLALLGQVRALAPAAGVRSNVIVGFPGETERDLEILTRLPGGRADGRDRRLRLLRRGRDRGGVVRRQAGRGRDPGPHRARVVAGRGADRPARRGADRRGGHRSWSRRSPPSPWSAAPSTRGRRSTAPCRCPARAAARSATSCAPG